MSYFIQTSYFNIWRSFALSRKGKHKPFGAWELQQISSSLWRSGEL